MRKGLLAFLLIGSVACRSSDNGTHAVVDAPGNGSGSGSGSGSGGGGSTVKAIRMTPPADGTAVTVSNVVVVAHVTSKKYGKIWVQDAGGGQYSGIELFCNYGGTTPNCTMTQAQVDALVVGSVISVSGSFSNFLPNTAPPGAVASFEISSPVITPSNSTMAPVAVAVDAATIAKAQLASPAADPYKGAYVKVTGSFPVSSISAAEFSMSCTDKSMPPKTGTTFSGFEVAGGGQTLAVGLSFYKTVTYCLPCAGVPMPYACTNPVTTQTFTGVSGIVEPEYASNGDVYLQISPTTDSDLPHQ